MIIVTGAAGFIGSCVVSELNTQGYFDLVLVDKFDQKNKLKNIEGKKYSAKVDRTDFLDWLHAHQNQIQFVIHIGARTDTAEFNIDIFNELNLNYTKSVWNACVEHGLPLIFASSAATYGLGEHGYDDDHKWSNRLKPLNPYGESKNDFDVWALSQEKQPYFWAGLKFFNVYGPNEYHKSRMASVVLHAYRQIEDSGKMKLFRSHNPNYKDGEQLRDFVYVKDVVKVILFLMHHRKDSGLYNLGTGRANSFKVLAESVFEALNLSPDITFVDTPKDIRDKYQYFTEAKMDKLKKVGYAEKFYTLEEGVKDYVSKYLKTDGYF